MDAKDQHIAWLRGQLVAKEAEMRTAERDLEAARQRFEGLKTTVEYFRGVVAAISGKDAIPSQKVKLSTDGTEEAGGLLPKEMMRAEFAGMLIKDAADLVVNQLSQPTHADEIADLIFDMRSEEDRQAVRRSFSSELRRGAQRGAWKKVGRNIFAPNHIDVDVEDTSENG